MSVKKRGPIRFGLLTALVWAAVAGGIIFLLWQVIIRISASYLPISTTTPNPTQVEQTIAALVNTQSTTIPGTATQTYTPSPTSRLTQTPPTLLPSPPITPTPRATLQTNTPAVLCDQASAGNPIDVTIPDDSLVPAGQNFVKTWKLVNSGTCTWTSSYTASFFYGYQMGAPDSVPLEGAVQPNQSVEISIEMIAPQTPGTYQGNWKLANPAGKLFGIGPNGNLPFWVRIIVPESQATPTGTPTLTITPNPSGTPTATATPLGQNSGTLTPIPGDSIDLDNITLDGEGVDLQYQVDEDNFHWLTPAGQATIGVFGSLQPSQVDCQAANMSHAPIAVESLPTGTYLCYLTNEGRYGRAHLAGVDPQDFTLTLDLLTWAKP